MIITFCQCQNEGAHCHSSQNKDCTSTLQPLIDGTERVMSHGVLGVLLDSKLTISDYVRPWYSPYNFSGTTVSGAISSTWWRKQLLLHPSCMPPRRGGGLWARGTDSTWNGWWPDWGVWVICQQIFRASWLSLRRLTETYWSQFHNVLLMSCSIYLRLSPPLRDPSVLGRITSYWPLKTIGIFFLGYYIMPSALLWVMPRGCWTVV